RARLASRAREALAGPPPPGDRHRFGAATDLDHGAFGAPARLRRACRHLVCAVGPRCPPRGGVLSRPNSYPLLGLPASLPRNGHRTPTTSEVPPSPPSGPAGTPARPPLAPAAPGGCGRGVAAQVWFPARRPRPSRDETPRSDGA